MTWYIILTLLLLAVFYVIFSYNEIIRCKNETDNAFGSIDAMLKKRYDLIPNLVETVKQYMLHEATVLQEVTRLREKSFQPLSTEEKIEVHNVIDKNLHRVLVAVENYPDLKASQNFLKLQASWNETEEQISAARRFYNTAVTDYNNSIQVFPANFMAKWLGYIPMNVLTIEVSERRNPDAKTLFES